MSKTDIPHICEISYSMIAQRTRDFQERSNNSSRTDNSRLVWMKFVTQYVKYQEMIDVCEHLKTKKLMEKLRILKLHTYFNKFYKKMIGKRWHRLQSYVVLKNIKEKFGARGHLMKEARAQHTSNFIKETDEFAIPDFTSLLAINSQNLAKTSDIHVSRNIEESCQERDVKMLDVKTISTKKDAYVCFGIALLVFIMIGLLISNNWKFISFMFFQKEQTIPVVDDDSLFWQNDTPNQKDVIDQILKII